MGAVTFVKGVSQQRVFSPAKLNLFLSLLSSSLTYNSSSNTSFLKVQGRGWGGRGASCCCPLLPTQIKKIRLNSRGKRNPGGKDLWLGFLFFGGSETLFFCLPFPRDYTHKGSCPKPRFTLGSRLPFFLEEDRLLLPLLGCCVRGRPTHRRGKGKFSTRTVCLSSGLFLPPSLRRLLPSFLPLRRRRRRRASKFFTPPSSSSPHGNLFPYPSAQRLES